MFVYFVSANISDAPLSGVSLFKNLNSLQELKIKSKKFDSYSDCIDSASSLARSIVEELNQMGESYSVFVDDNPEFNEDLEDVGEDIPSQVNPLRGIGILGKWNDFEIVRYYLIDNNHRDANGSLITKFIISVLTTPEKPQ
jgi:hypothetical protein